MTPLEIIKYIVEHLEGTPYEAWINVLLFMLFAAAVFAAILLLLGRGGRDLLISTVSLATNKLKNRKGYAPERERFRLRIEPYVELSGSLCFSLIGLYSAVLVGLALIINHSSAPWQAKVLGWVWVLASFFYMRINLEAASWAYHRIKNRHG